MTKDTQPTKPSQPSAWAMRAGELIFGHLSNPVRHTELSTRAAHIIDDAYRDCEAGVGELLEAAKNYLSNPQPVVGEFSAEVEAHNSAERRLEQAIAKCESGTGRE